MKALPAAILCLLLFGCRSARVQTLGDGMTKVPANFRLLPNSVDSLPLPRIDTSVFYRRAFSVVYSTFRIDTGLSRPVDGHLKFYAGGKFNLFLVNERRYSFETFDPAFNGCRGMVHRGPKKDTLQGLIFVQVSGLGAYCYQKVALYRKGEYLVLYRPAVRTEHYFIQSENEFYPRTPFPSW